MSLSDPNFIFNIISSAVGIFLLRFCSGQGIPARYVFGDSLVDCGNNNYIASLSRANFSPNGIDFLPDRTPTGRFTNGRTIADIIGQELGFQEFTPPYMAPNTTGACLLHGVNYGSGGGGILNDTGVIFVKSISLLINGGRLNMDAQIDDFENTRQSIISNTNATAASDLLRQSIFAVVMGSNDLINNYLSPLQSDPERDQMLSPEMFVELMISRFRLQLTRLYRLDARKFIVTNVGPLGCIPYQRDLNPSAGNDCVAFPNQMAQSFNQQLKSLVSQLSLTLEDSFFVYADVYHIVSDIVQNYTKYGFENAHTACCRISGRYGGLVPCGPTSTVCSDRSTYVFWDPYHPSDAANVLIARRLMNGDSNDAFPMNVNQLARACKLQSPVGTS